MSVGRSNGFSVSNKLLYVAGSETISRAILTFFWLFALAPTSALASSDAQLQECIGALNAIAQAIDNDRPQLDSDYVRALHGYIQANRALNGKALMDSKRIGHARDLRSCLAVGIDRKYLDLLVKAQHGYLSNDPAEDLAYCLAVLFSLEEELEIAFGKNVAGEIATQLGLDLGKAFAFISRLYRDPKVWADINRRAMEIGEAVPAKQLADNVHLCDWYSVPVSATIIAATASVRAKNGQSD